MGDHDEQDRMLPIANVGRIMKQILPPSAKISKEAKQTVQECATEFISFVTSEASDRCRKENRKTVNGDDVCWALSNLGFDNYAGVLSCYLQKIREAERERAGQIGRGKGESTQLGYSKITIGQPKGGEIINEFGSSKSPNTLMEFKIIDNMEDRHKSLVN